MEMLIIYDNEGYILSVQGGIPMPRTPVGVPFIITEVPNDKSLRGIGDIGVNVSVTPHEVILEDIPKSETELLKDELQETKLALAELAEALLGGE